MNEKRKDILEHYGALTQMQKVREELKELYSEVDKEIKAGLNGKNKDKIFDELCDVLNVVEYLKLIYDFNNMDIVQRMNSKLNRQLDRIKESE